MLFEVSHAAWHIWWISTPHFAHLSRELMDAWDQVQIFKMTKLQGLPMHLNADGVSTSLSQLSFLQPVYLSRISARMTFNRSTLYSLSSEDDNDKSHKSTELLFLLFACMIFMTIPPGCSVSCGNGCRCRTRKRAGTFHRTNSRSSSSF